MEAGRQVDAAVLEVGDRARRVRQVADVDQLEAELRGHDADGPVGEGAGDVTGELQLLLGELLDLGQVVVVVAHPHPQVGVGAAGLFGGRDRLPLAALQLAVQPEHRLDRLVGHALGDLDRRDAQLPEDRAVLRPLEFDLQGRAPVGRLGRQEVGDIRSGRVGDRLKQRELGLALAVLDEAQLAAGHPHPLAEFVQGEAARDPLMTDAVAQRGQFERGRGHSLSITKEFNFLRRTSPAIRLKPSQSGGRPRI